MAIPPPIYRGHSGPGGTASRRLPLRRQAVGHASKRLAGARIARSASSLGFAVTTDGSRPAVIRAGEQLDPDALSRLGLRRRFLRDAIESAMFALGKSRRNGGEARA